MSITELTGLDVPTGLLIGGEWAKGKATFPVLDPATEEPLAEVADGTVSDALDAVDAAQAALPGWAATAPRKRSEILHKAFQLMTERAEQFARLMSAENGKSLRDARGEAAYAAEFFRWYAEEAVRIEGTSMRSPSGANRILTLHQPIGVSLLITPWNFPAAMATRKIGPALAAGCSVVLKPAEDTPLTALALAALLREAGVPDGVVNVVNTSDPAPVVAAMMNDSRVRKMSFTGSTEVGRILLGQAAHSVMSTSMELGGNAPFIIFEDADIDAAVEGALIAKMRNGGEACTAANRFYVHDAVADKFNQAFAARLRSMKLGPGLDESTDLGPLVNEETRSKVVGLVDGALTGGASALIGGRAPERKGYFYEPTLLDGVAADSAILNTEIFGPVAPVVRFTDEADAIRWANGTEFGLVAYVYTQDLRRGLRVSEALESGMIGLNRGLVSDPAAPFGGVKQSGLGREGAHEGLLEYTETKYIATDW
ncbi:MAG TPA: NAD-dependent succinate-semialdehyde dehydrogenase [Trebonia sp.]|jgi:succinate-semialdehyde dehydrogenase/glutarate-semialdehyde dehydrogenase